MDTEARIGFSLKNMSREWIRIFQEGSINAALGLEVAKTGEGNTSRESETRVKGSAQRGAPVNREINSADVVFIVGLHAKSREQRKRRIEGV